MSRTNNRQTSTGAKIAAVLLVAAAIILFIALNFFDEEEYIEQAQLTAIGSSVPFARNTAGFHAINNGFFMLSENSISFYSNTGQLAMNRPVTGRPAFSGSGSYIVALEQGGHNAYIFNEHGEAYTATVNSPILNHSLGESGHLILITGNNHQQTLYLFEPRGQLVITSNLTHSNRMPIASHISNDGRRMAVAFLDFSGAELNFIVFLYSIDGNTATLTASNSYNHNQVLGEMRFINNHLITVSDKEIRSYNENGVIVAGVPVDAYITHISFANSYFAIALSQNSPNTPGERPGTVIFYDTNLNRLSSFESDNRITGLIANHNAALITSRRELTAVVSSGSTLWRRIITHDIIHASFLSSTHEIILAGNNSAQIFTIN